MSLRPQCIGPIPDQTIVVARAAFPKGNSYMTLRDRLGTLYEDADFAALFSSRGQPAEAPWRLALTTIFQFMEGLSDRQAANAVRARIDWKYALGLELTDPGFNYSVLSEFRTRLITGEAEMLVLERLLVQLVALGLLKPRGQQRTDSTHVLSAIRALNRIELVAETLRAALNQLATVAPEWLAPRVPAEWYTRYQRRIEDYRLPKGLSERTRYAEQVAADGYHLLALVEEATDRPELRTLEMIQILRQVWTHPGGVLLRSACLPAESRPGSGEKLRR